MENDLIQFLFQVYWVHTECIQKQVTEESQEDEEISEIDEDKETRSR